MIMIGCTLMMADDDVIPFLPPAPSTTARSEGDRSEAGVLTGSHGCTIALKGRCVSVGAVFAARLFTYIRTLELETLE